MLGSVPGYCESCVNDTEIKKEGVQRIVTHAKRREKGIMKLISQSFCFEDNCIERGDFVFINLSNKMIFMSNSGEYYNMDEIRCWIEEEAIFNDAYDSIESNGVELGVNRQSLWPNCNSRVNRNMDERFTPIYGCLISNEDKES